MTSERKTGDFDPGAYIDDEPESESDELGATREVEDGTDSESLNGQQVTGGQYGLGSDANQSSTGQDESHSPSSSSGGD